MKNTFRIFLIAAAALASLTLFSSCEKFLNQAPNGEQTKEYIFEDYLRSQRYLDMLYYNMPNTWVKDGKFSTSSTTRYGFLESATDMAEYSATYGATNMSFNVGDWHSNYVTEEVENVWYNCYKQIRRAWTFLDNCKNFVNEPAGRKPMMQGECHFMLAYYYSELIKRYGGVPLVKTVLTLEDDYKIPRSSYDEVAQFILDELDIAEGLVPDEWTTEDFGRVTKAWCKALRTRVLLYMASPLNNPSNDVERWKRAAAAAKDCIDYCETSGYHALSQDWQNIFIRTYPQSNKEVIIFSRATTYTHTLSLIHI